MGAPAVERSVRLLRLLAEHGPTPASTLAGRLGLARSTTYVLLDTLESAGLVSHGDDQRWALGVGVFELGSAYLRQEPLERAARPLLSRLTRHRVTAHLGVLDGTDVLYLLREDPRAAVPPLVTAVGVRLPAHLTASGRAILAALPAAQWSALYPRDRPLADRTGVGPRSVAELRALLDEERVLGWSREDGHVTAGVSSVAAVSYDHLGRPVCAISVTAPTPASPDQDALAALVPELRRAADTLTGRLRGRRGSRP